MRTSATQGSNCCKRGCCNCRGSLPRMLLGLNAELLGIEIEFSEGTSVPVSTPVFFSRKLRTQQLQPQHPLQPTHFQQFQQPFFPGPVMPLWATLPVQPQFRGLQDPNQQGQQSHLAPHAWHGFPGAPAELPSMDVSSMQEPHRPQNQFDHFNAI